MMRAGSGAKVDLGQDKHGMGGKVPLRRTCGGSGRRCCFAGAGRTGGSCGGRGGAEEAEASAQGPEAAACKANSATGSGAKKEEGGWGRVGGMWYGVSGRYVLVGRSGTSGAGGWCRWVSGRGSGVGGGERSQDAGAAVVAGGAAWRRGRGGRVWCGGGGGTAR